LSLEFVLKLGPASFQRFCLFLQTELNELQFYYLSFGTMVINVAAVKSSY